jgi:hypothetical protein
MTNDPAQTAVGQTWSATTPLARQKKRTVDEISQGYVLYSCGAVDGGGCSLAEFGRWVSKYQAEIISGTA